MNGNPIHHTLHFLVKGHCCKRSVMAPLCLMELVKCYWNCQQSILKPICPWNKWSTLIRKCEIVGAWNFAVSAFTHLSCFMSVLDLTICSFDQDFSCTPCYWENYFLELTCRVKGLFHLKGNFGFQKDLDANLMLS